MGNVPTGAPALQSITVALSCPPAMPLHCCMRRGRAPQAMGWDPGHAYGMVRPPEAAVGSSRRVVLTWGKIGCMG